MKDLFFVNSKGQDVNYFLWDIENPIATVVISHGMARFWDLTPQNLG